VIGYDWDSGKGEKDGGDVVFGSFGSFGVSGQSSGFPETVMSNVSNCDCVLGSLKYQFALVHSASRSNLFFRDLTCPMQSG